MNKLNIILLLALLATAVNVSWAESTLKIVTDPWPPYAYIKNNEAVGIDVDIALAVLGKMGIKGTIEMMPWKRSLASVKNLEADAILSAAITSSRKEYLYFPSEPISKGDTVFFQLASRQKNFNSLADFEGLEVGAMLGYKYCDELDLTPLLLQASRVATLEQSFHKLVSNRIDLVVAVDAVGLYKAKAMGIADKITIVENSRFCTVENHLAFSKKKGNHELAIQFGETLMKFKQSAEYQYIMKKYGTVIID